jgi:cell division transport system permease protein
MASRRFDFLFREVTSGLRRNGLVAFGAISTTFIALLLFGLALLISRQVGLIIEATTGNVEVAVYLSDPVNTDAVSAITNKLEGLDIVESVHYQTKAEACEEFKKLFAEQKALVAGVSCEPGKNPLPASLRVKLSEPEQFRQVPAILGCRLEENGYACATPGIDNVVDQHKVVDTLFKVTRILRVGVLVAALVMLVSAAVLIANTVRMGLFARRKEIGIMKLVGATNWRIRLPFLVEGLFESLIGATVAILFLFAMKVAFIDPLYGSTALRFIPWITNSDVVAIIPWLVIAGALVALFAGLVGMRRFLDV